MNSIEGITLVPVDEPKEPGFYIKYNHVPWGQSTTVIRVNDGLDSITRIWGTDDYPPSDIKREFEDYKWIHIQIKKPQTNIPNESSFNWVWRDVGMQEFNWQKVGEPNG